MVFRGSTPHLPTASDINLFFLYPVGVEFLVEQKKIVILIMFPLRFKFHVQSSLAYFFIKILNEVGITQLCDTNRARISCDKISFVNSLFSAA